MSSVEYLRNFVNERLTAAAEEIFGVFKQTIVEYEEEIDRQRKLLENVSKPEIKLLRIEPPQQHVCKEEEEEEEEEAPAHQQLCIQQRDSSLDQEDPDPPQIKEEQEELCINQGGEQLDLKQEETDTSTLATTYGESDHSEDQTIYIATDKSVNATETELPGSMCISWQKDDSDSENSEVAEPKEVNQLLFHNYIVSQHQNGNKRGESGSGTFRDTHTGKKVFKCDRCEKTFKYRSDFQRHLMIHTGEKPYSCNLCGKRFNQKARLSVHLRIHTGEKPYSCKTCGNYFRYKSQLTVHMRGHTGEKPFTCETCGKDFRRSDELAAHIRRIH
ncbi:oocyte zinc finger protein XlCOF7.1-like [Plectropomus leopardus]|uniref:oocyte zinc finger protein XlCOF7.1-like n=1 Tax=Plectropomus leopardus TaxID=160734 RepID=UPI001C4D9E9B|nr:oocyte zinc finger protein XlCOF7.1-like [Plectropomus leopardus]